MSATVRGVGEVEETETNAAPPRAVKSKRTGRLAIGAVVGVALLAGGTRWWLSHRYLESTDDAQVDADVVAVPAKTGGTIAKIDFVDDQPVHAGDVLAEIDDAPQKARLAQADAAVKASQASADAADADAKVAEANAHGNKSAAEAVLQSASVGVSASADGITEAKARVSATEIALAQATKDRDRAQSLLATGAISQSQLDSAETAYQTALANRDQAKAHLSSTQASIAQAQSKVSEASAHVKQVGDVEALIEQAHARAEAAHAQVLTALATRDLAALELSYTKVLAPSDGVVSKKSIAVGQMVVAGQPIVQLVPSKDVWVTANFKETQLARMQAGQPVTFTVDAYPGVDLHGTLASFSGATGARFALLPPDNASGNFTKVVQRVPVKVLVADPPSGIVLRPGMSVDLTVDTK